MQRYKLFLLVGLLSMIADQVTKVWARASLETDALGNGIPVVVIENFFDWRLSKNAGSAFGFFANTDGARIFLSVIGVVAVFVILWMLTRTRDDQRRLTIGLALVAGGAVGNLIDRIAFGVVTDFVVWKYYEHEWPTFNVADAALVVGVALLFLDMGRERDPALQAASPGPEQPGSRASKAKGKPIAGGEKGGQPARPR